MAVRTATSTNPPAPSRPASVVGSTVTYVSPTWISRSARGMSMAGVATRVGDASASAFVAAFHRQVGVPPGRYFGG